jgi:hypothetical protein
MEQPNNRHQQLSRIPNIEMQFDIHLGFLNYTRGEVLNSLGNRLICWFQQRTVPQTWLLCFMWLHTTTSSDDAYA